MAFFTCVFLAVTVVVQLLGIDAQFDSTAGAADCASKGAVPYDGKCYKIVTGKVFWNDAEQICQDKEWALAAPKSQDALKNVWSGAMGDWILKNSNSQECVGPAWISLNDKGDNDAGTDKTSANWKWGNDSNDNIAGSDLGTFWMEGFPEADLSGPTIELDCVAAFAVLEPQDVPQGLINFPCEAVTAGDLSSIELPHPLNGTDVGKFELPDIGNMGDNENLKWCPICQFSAGGGDGSSSSGTSLYYNH